MDDVVQTGKELISPLPEVRPKAERPATFLANVDNIVDRLWSDASWRQYVDAITNKTAITGKWESDRTLAALRVQEEAKASGVMDVASAKLSKIMRAIETLLRRDKLGRFQRLAALLAPPVEMAA
jgi:hypothetical protein